VPAATSAAVCAAEGKEGAHGGISEEEEGVRLTRGGQTPRGMHVSSQLVRAHSVLSNNEMPQKDSEEPLFGDGGTTRDSQLLLSSFTPSSATHSATGQNVATTFGGNRRQTVNVSRESSRPSTSPYVCRRPRPRCYSDARTQNHAPPLRKSAFILGSTGKESVLVHTNDNNMRNNTNSDNEEILCGALDKVLLKPSPRCSPTSGGQCPTTTKVHATPKSPRSRWPKRCFEKQVRDPAAPHTKERIGASIFGIRGTNTGTTVTPTAAASAAAAPQTPSASLSSSVSSSSSGPQTAGVGGRHVAFVHAG